MKAVLDTNVLISVFLSNGVPRRVFKRVLKGNVVLLMSKPLMREFEGVVSRKKFGFSKEEVARMTGLLWKVGYIVAPEKRINYIREDPDDNRVLECAVAGRADYIVSGDKHLLLLEKFKDIKIVNASQFLKCLK